MISSVDEDGVTSSVVDKDLDVLDAKVVSCVVVGFDMTVVSERVVVSSSVVEYCVNCVEADAALVIEVISGKVVASEVVSSLSVVSSVVDVSFRKVVDSLVVSGVVECTADVEDAPSVVSSAVVD